MSNDVKVKIDLTKPIGKLGFGIPLILSANVDDIPYTEVSSLPEVVTAGFATTTNVYKAAALMFSQTNAPKTIAVCATANDAASGLDASKPWRQLIVVDDNTSETIEAVSAAVENLEGKMYFVGVSTDADPIVPSTAKRTVVFYCDATEDAPVPVAALVGETAGRQPGSFTYKNLILKGIEPAALNDAQIEAIHTSGGITFVTKAGDNVTSGGKTVSGEYIDVVDSEDYIVQQLAYRTQKILNNSAKIPYDNNGIAMLESAAVDVLQDAYNNGMIATKADGSPDYFVSYALREDTSEADRASRKYLGGNFGFSLAGAIHYVEVTGTITA